MIPEQGNPVRQVNEVLQKWRGAHAQFWSYTAALATLEIRLFRPDRPGNIHVVCSPCVSIAGPVYWGECELTVGADNADESLLLVCDQGASVRILCRQVYTFENAEPFPFPPGSSLTGVAF